MIKKNAVKLAESMNGKINRKYTLGCSAAIELMDHYTGAELVLMSFQLGYDC